MSGAEGFSMISRTRPPAPWIGGKRLLSKKIIELIDKIPHRSYVEPFFGMGGVFFRRERIPRTEIINDISGEVFNFLRITQRHHLQLLDTLRYNVASREEFERLVSLEPSSLTDLERAARFVYIQKLTFAGKVCGRSFGVSRNGGSRFNFFNVAPVLEAVHQRLSGVVIENLDWTELVPRYDCSTALFYLDPPYFGHETDYGRGIFNQADFARLAQYLREMRGSFVLSINDHPAVRSIFDGFEMLECSVDYTVSLSKRAKARELIYFSGI